MFAPANGQQLRISTSMTIGPVSLPKQGVIVCDATGILVGEWKTYMGMTVNTTRRVGSVEPDVQSDEPWQGQ